MNLFRSKPKTPALRNSMSCAPCRGVYLLISLAFTCFALAPQARAVCRRGCDFENGNTFLGEDALINNTSVSYSTAIGFEALYSNTTGFFNTAIGSGALFWNTTGNYNTATGDGALGDNTTGGSNTASGFQALHFNTTGGNNTATGMDTLLFNTTGHDNIAEGFYALLNNTTGSSNIALGSNAGVNLTTGSNNIDIGNAGIAGESGITRIGIAGTQTATYISGIRETPLAQGVAIAVGITADGQLGVRASSARFKEAITPMEKASEAIFSLKPVAFRYKNDPAALPQFGLVAEEVAKVAPKLVVTDEQGKPFTVRYDEVNAMLLNEFLKEHKAVQELEKQVAELTAGLQKVGAQLELSKSVPQTAQK